MPLRVLRVLRALGGSIPPPLLLRRRAHNTEVGRTTCASRGAAMTTAERRWCWVRAALVMALTMVPYLWCWRHTPPGRQFCWVLYGRDDHAVYMAWMRQAAEGRF